MNWEPIIEALLTALRVGAIILPVFLLVDYLNHKYGHKIEHLIAGSKGFMPLVAAILGMLPGCNLAVVIAILFTSGVASLGTLVAAIIALSDEALYVFLPLGFTSFIPVMILKFILAVVVGYTIDFFPKFKFKKTEIEKEIEVCCVQHPHQHGLKGEIGHAIVHTLRVMMIVFITLGVFNYVQDTYGTDFIGQALGFFPGLEPFLAALAGLIPGCGTSIAIATLYTKGAITLGAVVAGLSTASGEVLVVLAARGIKFKNLAQIAAILVVSSTIAGILINLFL